MTVRTYNIGLNRGRPRLWLEGKAVETVAGFAAGTHFTVETARTVTRLKQCEANAEGARTISGKPGRCVIDLAGAVVEGLGVAHGDKVEVTFTPGCISIRKTEG